MRPHPPCTAPHTELRETDAWFELPLVGTQHTREDKYGPAEDIEMRNCSCGSTLGRVMLVYLPTKGSNR